MNTTLRSLTLGCMLAVPPLAAGAQSTPAVPPAQSRAFAIGYTLRACDLRAIAFTRSVQGLKTVDDDDAGAEVARLHQEATALRHTQAVSYGQMVRLLTTMNGPLPLRAWASQTAAALSGPLVYSGEALPLMKTEPDTAAVMAELAEIKSVKAAADQHLPEIAAWLQVSGGPLSVWTAEVGTYSADLRAAANSPGQTAPSLATARHLLQSAPPASPPAARECLAGMVPRGGNLGDLATVSPLPIAPDKLNSVSENLLGIYVLRKAPEGRAQP